MNMYRLRKLRRIITIPYYFVRAQIIFCFYPFLKVNYCNYRTWNESIPEGWRKAFGWQMWKEVRRELKREGLLHTFRIFDIKEKYGHLDVTAASTNKIDKIFEKYEYLSERTCINCGKNADYQTQGYILPLCENCIDEYGKANALKFGSKELPWYGYCSVE